MPRDIEVEHDKDRPEGEATIIITEPQETRYTLDQVEMEVEMADQQIEAAKQRQAAAKAKLKEARAALKAA